LARGVPSKTNQRNERRRIISSAAAPGSDLTAGSRALSPLIFAAKQWSDDLRARIRMHALIGAFH
jgi:hypothetical protein